jgi:oligopeptide transport system permease protein
MIARLAWRAALALLTLVLATAALYTAIRLLPGTPWDDQRLPERKRKALEALYHLDRSIPVGYLFWIRDAARGDLGASYAIAIGVPVGRLIRQAAPTSLLLGLLGLGTASAVALAAGLASARRPGGAWDRTWSGTLYVLNAAPTFWIAMVLQELLAIRLRVLPTLWNGGISGWILPPACLALGSLAFLFRFSRACLIEAAESPCVAAARARGLPERLVLGRHALAGAGVHLVTLAGLLAPAAVAGSVIVERVFALPGLGRLFFEAAGERDHPVVMGVGLLMAVVSVAASAIMDMLYLAADPRLRRGREVRR